MGIIHFTEGLNRRKRWEKSEFSLSVWHPFSSALRHWLSWSSGLWTWTGVYYQLPWFSGLPNPIISLNVSSHYPVSCLLCVCVRVYVHVCVRGHEAPLRSCKLFSFSEDLLPYQLLVCSVLLVCVSHSEFFTQNWPIIGMLCHLFLDSPLPITCLDGKLQFPTPLPSPIWRPSSSSRSPSPALQQSS